MATPPSMSTEAQSILSVLKKSGKEGMSKSALKIKRNSKKDAAFQSLLENRKIANLGSAARSRYVLREFYNPLEIACDTIEAYLRSENQRRKGKLTLVSQTKLIEKLPAGAVRKSGKKALDWLAAEGKILKIGHGNGTYFLSVEVVRNALPDDVAKPRAAQTVKPVRAAHAKPKAAAETKQAKKADHERIMAAYRELVDENDFKNVEISALQQRSGIDMATLKEYLLSASAEGRAVLGFGDWSLASESVRAGAVYLHGKPHLMVRFS